MRFTPLDKQARAEWRGMLNPTDGAHLGAAAALFLLSALALPLSRVEAVAGLYLLYAVVFYYMLTHSLASILAVALPGALLFGVSALAPGLPHPYLMPAVYTALVLGGVGGGFLVIHCRERKHLAFLLLPAVAYAIVAVLEGPLQGLLVLIPVALSLVLGHAMLTCRPQTPVLITTAAVLALAGAVTYLVWYALSGWPQPNPLAYLGDLVGGGVERVFRDALAALAEMGEEMPNEIDASAVGAVLGNALIGAFLAGCGILSFLIFRTYLRVLTAWGTLSRVPLRVGAMTVSPIAAVLFLFSFLVSLFVPQSVAGAVCDNLSLVLQPALVLVGVSSLLAREHEKRSMLSTLLLLGMLMLLFYNFAMAFTVAAFLGAFRVLMAAIMTRKKDAK